MPRSPLAAYDAAAARASAQVIASYSTSFSLAAHLLRGRVRTDIRNLYAVVRIADELVDAAGSQAGLSPTELAAALDAYEAAVLAAPSQRFHTDPVLHAYAATAPPLRLRPGAYPSLLRLHAPRSHTDQLHPRGL